MAIAMDPRRRGTARMSMSEGWRTMAVPRSAGLAGPLDLETALAPGVPAPDRRHVLPRSVP